MGGSGSSKWLKREKGTVVGDHRQIDIRNWHRKGLLQAGGRFSWCWWNIDNGEKLAAIHVQVQCDRVVLSYRVRQPDEQWEEVDETVSLAFSQCHYGGQRPWFLCPARSCGRRVSILYIVRKYFLCRHCHGLSYISQQYDRGDRAVLRAQNIRFKLGGDLEVFNPFPAKPKRMRWNTYLRLRQEAERAQMEISIEFSNWISRQESRLRIGQR